MKEKESDEILGKIEPSKAIVKLAIPATLALMAKAIYNIVDTAYIGMLHSDVALTAVGVTLPLLLIMVSIENIFASGAAVIAGRQLGAGKSEDASKTVTTVIGISLIIGVALCLIGIIFIKPLLR
ncbi:MAG: MATE family efflux transporter [Spirochaetales bacterium]|nr:MATE family efflux transporter [Spirochaetales bacterium]